MQRCPNCEEPISTESMNINEGVALCPVCKELTRLSELIKSDRTADEIVLRPKSGCSIRECDDGVVVVASLRSVGGALGVGAFALIWNSIISIFVMLMLAGLYANLIGPLPDWFPAPGIIDGKPQMNDQPMGLGETLFLCVFLLPFVFVGLGSLGIALVLLFGRIEVFLGEHDSYTATGLGPFKLKHRFDASQVQSVSYRQSTPTDEDGSKHQTLVVTADRSIEVATMLDSDRTEWLRIVLKELLLNPSDNRYAGSIPYLSWQKHRHTSCEYAT